MFEKVLVPMDGSPLAETALLVAQQIARSSNGAVDLVLAHEPSLGRSAQFDAKCVSDEDTYLAMQMGKARRAGISTTFAVMKGPAVDMICTRAYGVRADLIAMATHGRGVSRLVLGSVADKVLRGSQVPILLRHPVVHARFGLDREAVEQDLPALSGAGRSAGE